MAGYFLLKRSGDQFMFDLRAGNNLTILTSERYTRKESAQGGIDAVKATAHDDGHYQRKTSAAQQPYFFLVAANNQVVGTSQMYSSTTAMEDGVASCKTNAPGASTRDET